MKRIKTTVCIILAFCFTALIVYSGYQIYLIQADYKAESEIHSMIMEYKPEETQHEENKDGKNEKDKIINQSIIDLQAKFPDAIGWLVLPNTQIDYPFMQYKDNDYYLNHDINGKNAVAGTVFMDYRCNEDFTSQNTIIYGHHMKNGSMFGTLKLFNDKTFFEENRNGIIYLPYNNLTLEFFAYLVIKPDDQKIYTFELSDTYFDYVEQNAKYYRDIGLSGNDRIVTLSTCAYEFNNARMVLLAKII